MVNNRKGKLIFKSNRGGKCDICNTTLQNLNRHYESNAHKNQMNKNLGINFEYKQLIQILKYQKRLIDCLIGERINVKRTYKSFKNELIEVINRCTDFANSLDKFEKNVVFNSEIKNLTKTVEKSTSNFFIIRSNKTEQDLLIDELEPYNYNSNITCNRIHPSLKDIEEIFGSSKLTTISQIVEEFDFKKTFIKKFGINRSQKLVEYIRPFYKSLDAKRLFIVKNHFNINIIENIIFKSLMINFNKISIKKLTEVDLKKFCNEEFDNFYDKEVKKYEGNDKSQNSNFTQKIHEGD